jgi:hypothetical protein
MCRKKGVYLFNPFGKTKAAKRRVTLTAVARVLLGRRLATSSGPLHLPARH